MKKTDLIGLALRNFLRRKVRSLLTILGVTIGTAAVVVMLSLGIGMSEGFKAQMAMMGSLTIIQVHRYYTPPENSQGGEVKPAVIDDKVIEQISQLEGVSVVTPVLRTSAKLVSGKYISYVNLYGLRPEALEELGYAAAEGRLLSPGESEMLLFGADTTMNFYNPKTQQWGNPGGRPPVNVMLDRLQLTLDMSYGEGQHAPGQKPAKLYRVRTAGVLERAQGEQDWNVFIDINYLQKIMREYNSTQGRTTTATGYEEAIVKVPNINQVERVAEQIRAMKLGTHSLQDILQGMKDQLFMIQAVLGGIGAISLLVAALGITNTMVMSIYERTREIGVMKVLGCLLTDIRKLFLWEAGIIGFLGGVIGLLISLGASLLLNRFGGSLGGFLGGGYSPDGRPLPISVIPLWLALASVGFATMVGLVSGLYPAHRAMKLSALEAIRTE